MSPPQGSQFARRVAGTFATKVVTFALGLISTVVVARLLGPAGRGEFYLLTLVPTTLLTFGQLGVPSALVFFTGRGSSLRELIRTSLALVMPFAALVVVPVAVLGGFLARTILASVSEADLHVVILVTPLLFWSMLGSAMLLGRQAIGQTNLLSLGQTLTSLVLIVVLVGVADLGVHGAVYAYVIVGVGATITTAMLIRRLTPSPPQAPIIGARTLLGYGLRIYPGSLATFFSYRVDVFLLSAMLGSPTQVGLYSLAVGFAELVFYVPDSIATVFFPRIAASNRGEADGMAPAVVRQTVLMTAGAALLLLPASWLAIRLVLPAFADSYAALVVLTPGVVALSVSKVLSGYVSGLGRPLPVGGIAVASLVVNVVMNLVLIPLLGIVGAAAASLISYSVNAALMVLLSSRMSDTSPGRLVIPRRADAASVVRTVGLIIRDVRTVIRAPHGPDGTRGTR